MPPGKPLPKNTTGILFLTVVVMVDALLLLWGWHWYQNHTGGVVDTAAEAPVPEENLAPAPPEPRPVAPIAPAFPPASSSASQAPPEAEPTAPPPAENRRPAPQAAKGPPQLDEAVSAYQALKPKYRGKPFYRTWTKEFLSHEDLAALNRRYFKDHDAMAFILGTIRSSNFARMLQRFSASGDLRAFVQDMMGKRSVMLSARSILEDPKVMAAAKTLTVPGLPPLGALMSMGEKRARGRPVNDQEAMQNILETNPDIARQLDGRRR